MKVYKRVNEDAMVEIFCRGCRKWHVKGCFGYFGKPVDRCHNCRLMDGQNHLCCQPKPATVRIPIFG